jgi:hypothetical protein
MSRDLFHNVFEMGGAEGRCTGSARAQEGRTEAKRGRQGCYCGGIEEALGG